MWYIVIALIFLAGFLLSCKEKLHAGSPGKPIIDDAGNATPNILLAENDGNAISKKDIEIQLNKLSSTEPPTELAYGAMCYKVSRPPDTASYICPVCGERTLYKVNGDDSRDVIYKVHGDISYSRELVKKIKGINVILDESEFCRHCSPEIEIPQLCLLINYENSADTSRVCGVDSEDITLIAEFLSGSVKHVLANDAEEPLVKHIDRIEELLGVKLEKENNE